MYFQSIYIAVIIQIVNEKLKILWFCYEASFFF